MLKPEYDVIALGNAIVDVLANFEEHRLKRVAQEHELVIGGMNLIDREFGRQLLGMMNDPIIKLGGSANNTVMGITSFGGKCAFSGKIATDFIGDQFCELMKDDGLDFKGSRYEGDEVNTGRSFILISPDGTRTMNTYLGANRNLAEQDIDEELIASARFLYLEGYLFERALAKKAFIYASDIARQASRKVILNLCDPKLVTDYDDEFRDFVHKSTDILFATEKEIKALYKEKTLVGALQKVKEDVEIAAITRSEKGSVIISGDEVIEVEGRKVEVVDVTGAGDQYAAGFIYGLIRNMSLQACARLASAAASDVITHLGARPNKVYAALIVKELIGSLGDRK